MRCALESFWIALRVDDEGYISATVMCVQLHLRQTRHSDWIGLDLLPFQAAALPSPRRALPHIEIADERFEDLWQLLVVVTEHELARVALIGEQSRGQEFRDVEQESVSAIVAVDHDSPRDPGNEVDRPDLPEDGENCPNTVSSRPFDL